MKIESITISNWRSIDTVNLTFQDLMIIIGQNNHGKSNLLSALLFFFGEVKHTTLDFHHNCDDLYVQVTFNDLDDNDKTTFKKYLANDNTIKVRKTAFNGGSFIYNGYLSTPTNELLNFEVVKSFSNRESAKSLPFYEYLPDTGRITQALIEEALQQYIENNSDDIEFDYRLESSNFLGLKSVASSIFGKVYFIPAVKSVTEDMSGKDSILTRLFQSALEDMSQNNEQWSKLKEELSSKFNLLNKYDLNGDVNNQRPQQLSDLEDRFTQKLSEWDTKIDFEVSPPDIESILFKDCTTVWLDDGVKTDVIRKGHGLQRALIFTFISIMADIARENMDSTESGSRKTSNSNYFIFEEPELFLHPQAQRLLFDSLRVLSESGNQVILCTHSSALIDLELYKSICIVKKCNEKKSTNVYQCLDDIFVGDPKKDFNLVSWINPERAELFFSKKVVLVEGQTEKTILPYLAKQLGCHKHDYTIIDCGSKTAIPLYIKLLNKFSIPYIAIYDKDHQEGKSDQAIDAANKVTQLIEDAVLNQFGRTISLVNDIEEELGLFKGTSKKAYKALEAVSAADYVLPADFRFHILSVYE